MQVELSTKNVLCIYGWPEPLLYDKLLIWLEEDPTRFVFILEEERHVVDHERIRICSPLHEEEIKKICTELLFLEFEYAENLGENPKACQAVFAKVKKIEEQLHLIASDFQDRGLNLLHNFLHNAKTKSKAKNGKGLFGSFSNVPAIICGAGLSIEKEAAYLKGLQDRALILAGGTALSLLASFEVIPHFGGVIDPHLPLSKQLFPQLHDIPLFFQSRAHPQMLAQIPGQKLWIAGSQNDFFEKEFFEGGWNVATFLTALACHLGCSPIILLGVDLARPASDISYEQIEQEQWFAIEDDLLTKKDFFMASCWLSEFVKNHPEVEWINSSNGLKIDGFIHKPLREVHLEKQEDLQGAVHSAVQALELAISEDYQEFYASLLRVENLCQAILQFLEKLFPHPFEKHPEYILLELEIEKELAYDIFVRPVWQVWRPVFLRKQSPHVPAGYGICLHQWVFIQGVCRDAKKI